MAPKSATLQDLLAAASKPTATDFAAPPRSIDVGLLAGRAHYEIVMRRLLRARCSIWIATANLKELLVEGPRRSARSRDRYGSVLASLDALAADGVELRLLHAGQPSRAFRRSFDSCPRLVAGGV
ncbi:MAG TPA: hypothetical protein VK034_31300, partial [Enhygromyxa sp.]|nr:hypothetical protein [Enhygromyxa sp.]